MRVLIDWAVFAPLWQLVAVPAWRNVVVPIATEVAAN